MMTSRLHTRAEWTRVRTRYAAVLRAYTNPSWERRGPDAVWWLWQPWVYLWTNVPFAVYTAVRWAPFWIPLWITQVGGWAAWVRIVRHIPADIVLGAMRMVTRPAHSGLVLLELLVPWGLLGLLALIGIGQRRAAIVWWWQIWSWVWMIPWTWLMQGWLGWWAGGGHTLESVLMTGPPANRGWDKIQRLKHGPIPTWEDRQMLREARQLGLDWTPPALRPRSKEG